MNAKHILAAAAMVCVSLMNTLHGAASDAFETKVSIASESMKGLSHDAPCFLVLPEGPGNSTLMLDEMVKIVTDALEEKGYRVVKSESEAVVFIKIDYDLSEPFETEYKISARPVVDYSNSAASHNHAATMAGGRYSELRNDEVDKPGRSGGVLGPNGEIIDLAEVKPLSTDIKRGDSTVVALKVHPIAFQITAWMFKSDKADEKPTKLWQVTANHENLKDELLEYQLEQLARLSTRYIGKSLKKPKLVSRSD